MAQVRPFHIISLIDYSTLHTGAMLLMIILSPCSTTLKSRKLLFGNEAVIDYLQYMLLQCIL